MTISDANPVQFWDPDQETFNEKEVDGIFQRCFCMPWNCDDTLPTQFLDETGLVRHLVAVDEDDSILFSGQFSEIATSVYQYSFIPQNEEICDEIIQLKILNDSAAIIQAPSTWTNAGGGSFDTKNATQFIEAVTSVTGQVEAYQGAIVPSGEIVSIPITISFTGTWTSGLIAVSMLLANGSGTTVSDDLSVLIDPNYNVFTGTGTYERTYIMQTTSQSARLYIQLTDLGFNGTVTATITVPVGLVIFYSEQSVIKKSDCLSVKSNHDETVLIEYSSNRNFAGLNYSSVTPDPSFNLRVPAVFFRQRFPQEKETIELSNSRSIQLSAQVKAQKHLQVKNMPDYMHRKLLLALSHQFVTIDGQDWVLAEEYELIPPSNPRWPMQKAHCWLTEKDYIMRSIL